MQVPISWLALLLGSLMIPFSAVGAGRGAADIDERADSEMAQFVRSVLDDNPRVHAARAALEASTALKAAAARPLHNPQLSVDAENADSDTRALGISQTIDWGGKRSARTAVAESERLAVEAEYLSAQWGVTVELLTGLSGYQTSIERNALATERVRLMNQFAAFAERRFEAGDLGQVELDLATLAAVEARMQSATVAGELAEMRETVRTMAPDVPPAKWPTLSDRLPSLPAHAANPEVLVQTLPQVLTARHQADAAAATVELRKRERRPDPTIGLAGGSEDDETLVGLNFSIPLFVRNRFDHEVSAAMGERTRAQQTADDVIRRAAARLAIATERYRLSQGAWGDWKRTGRVSVDRRVEQLGRLWEAGELSTTDYLVQLRQVLDVEESALDLRQALWRAWFEWLSASGQIDTWLGQGESGRGSS